MNAPGRTDGVRRRLLVPIQGRNSVTHRSTTRRVDAGTAAVELVVLAPVLMVIFLFVVGLGRMAHARQQVEGVAADAARAASMQRGAPAATRAAAQHAARRSLGETGVSCQELTVQIDMSQ